ncbi:chemotaxis protein CheB [Paracoccus sp. 1_MG-2023]|uniref:chemotaxis protein CheB n=1 Tax=unclassified Paracoccus (in: a-proteobacteria) TaxID=2688777 RepID=UPI001C08E9F6|nr:MULTISPECIES: chemotaxis protein CheB [unclassified Paracoccus (in: a-proteobacteria)]MBU2958188.1 PAS domain-containing protein [Paracoccus sp. C2R09]MDO6668315.1 chemotaxis protein CheB [Paracoccus sp. 1_MG-2023]
MNDETPKRDETRQDFAVVAIGASAGGLEALQDLLRDASRDDPAAYVIIQHLDPTHDSVLAELLDRRTALTVQQAQHGTLLRPGQVYTIPPGSRMLIKENRLVLTDFEQPRGLRRPIDDFFESLAQARGSSAACVILSGTGADGTLGLRAIKEHGGVCVVQEPRTARYDGMPLSAEATGLVDFVLAPDRILASIMHFFESRDNDMAEESMLEDARRICELVHEHCGHDFSGYKMTTLVRRIRRRMQVLGIQTSREYLAQLEHDCDECDALQNEFLINVTRFFRDPELFRTLRDRAIRPMVRDSDGEELRIWVPGCSSGEEAYSIAMLVDAEMRAAGLRPRFTVFASDIDRKMIEVARAGSYPISALADIPEDLRGEYTTHRDSLMQITPQLRDRVRFSLHSVLRDPPFARVDLISCRNLLIYLDEGLQARVLPLFHYALRPGGYLFLGPSEGVRRESAHFEELDRPARLFLRDQATARLPLSLPFRSTTQNERNQDQRQSGGSERPSVTAAQRRVLDRFSPASLQVSRAGEVVWSAGRLSRFLSVDPTARKPVLAQQIVHPGLKEAVTAAIDQVTTANRAVIIRDLVARSEMGSQAVSLFAEPLPDRSILLVFQEAAHVQESDSDSDTDELSITESRADLLEEELRLTQIELHGAVEELETANEELKSSNEEMMSMNEELQSTNEELSTVNDELKSKIDDLTAANSDLQNFFSATKIPLLVVDREIRVRNFTNAALQIFPLRRSDHGRPLTDVSNVFASPELESMAREVIRTGEAQWAEMTEAAEDRVWRIDAKAYRGPEGNLEGAMLVFEDVTALRDLRIQIERQEDRLNSVRHLARIAVWQLDRSGRTITVDDSSGLLGVGQTAELPLQAFAGLIAPDDRDALLADLRGCAEGRGFRRTVRPSSNGHADTRLEAAGEIVGSGANARVLGVMVDVTAAQSAADLREAVIREMDHRVKNLFTQISAMLRMAARETDDVREVVQEVSSRISALASSHSLTTAKGGTRELSLRELIETSLAPYRGANILLEGGNAPVQPANVVPLSLILHELATNAFKYGVLGPVEGQLHVTWATQGDDLVVTWSEEYAGPRTDIRPERGFGSVLLEGAAAQIGAELSVDQTETHRSTRLDWRGGAS